MIKYQFIEKLLADATASRDLLVQYENPDRRSGQGNACHRVRSRRDSHDGGTAAGPVTVVVVVADRLARAATPATTAPE